MPRIHLRRSVTGEQRFVDEFGRCSPAMAPARAQIAVAFSNLSLWFLLCFFMFSFVYIMYIYIYIYIQDYTSIYIYTPSEPKPAEILGFEKYLSFSVKT